ncbi:MAG TPA: heparinase II/III family protein [Gemmatimonadales bacterium]|nr:heparinase II/III family protein [Gemmatimonadales bacterium]
MLTTDGGVCPEDGIRLIFDPWSPGEHRCGRCGRTYRGERHDVAWAHYQHLWVMERAATLSTLAAVDGGQDAAERANALLQAYHCYPEYPNRDNVLGPSRLFFSTYLESIWLTSYLAAAVLLREAGLLGENTAEVVTTVAEEAANIIGDFDEGLSNRQTWHNAALASVAVWFEDEELATRAIEGRSGMLTHLLHGFGPDGMWFEGDNYHLFALRGQLLATGWARQAGVDLLADPHLAGRLSAALRAPSLTVLPDLTFPARKDSRFGVSLAQPMYLELWEIGLAWLERAGGQSGDLWGWLDRLYHSPAPQAQTFDSYLHEAEEPFPGQQRTRADLSWWSLLEMRPSLPATIQPWSPKSSFIEGHGLAVLRSDSRYVSLECGESGGGHGHADRLNIILHADGEYWLPDLGTGSYVARDLFWYRSTLAHNAPRLDGVSQEGGAAACDNFDESGDWGWARGRYGDLTRTVIAGPKYVLDVLELTAVADHLLELPLHLTGEVELLSAGHWAPAELPDEFVRGSERFVPSDDAPVVLRSRGNAGATLAIHLLCPGEVLRATAPGIPGSDSLLPFYLLRVRARSARIVCLFESTPSTPAVRRIRTVEGGVEVETSDGTERHLGTVEGWEVRTARSLVRLGGARRQPPVYEPLVSTDRPLIARGAAPHIMDPPALDGSLKGFDTAAPLELDHEDQYRRSEDPYPGPEEFSARAFVNWNDDGLYVGVKVITPEVFARDPETPPLRLDNDPDEIHGDGIQLYVRLPADDTVHGWLIVPSIHGGELVVRPVSGTDAGPGLVQGAWRAGEEGYTLTVLVRPPGWEPFRPGAEIGFDLLVNRMLPGRQRRAGQLVWSGGGGWVWLRGDRQDPERLGLLELS